MADKRDNALILLVDAPVPEKTGQELKKVFGPERAVHINLDLMHESYRSAKSYGEAILILSYEKSPKHPDLTWLDPEDPGFLEAKGKSYDDRVRAAFALAFFTGAKKAVMINHLCPAVKQEWIDQALAKTDDRTVSLGAVQDGSFHLLGLTQENLRVLEEISFSSGRTAEDIAERARRLKLTVHSLPDTYSVRDEETLRKWIDSKDNSPSLFKEPPAKAPEPHSSGEKKHGRGRRHNNGAPAEGQAENSSL
ncbi:MAG: DUF2064 domain-containing protein [Elusimicrobiales bacterium]|jgi:glycosyltransferase A (GT-A) superfamily protein (DUF2064 family)|nr:DUF2064 domain-containing protein [Elusimicrobiales bacterium]